LKNTLTFESLRFSKQLDKETKRLGYYFDQKYFESAVLCFHKTFSKNFYKQRIFKAVQKLKPFLLTE